MHIKLNNLQKSYISLNNNDEKNGIFEKAVSDVSLEIPSDGIFGFIGKSGAGKSTLVRLISLMERPDSGEIYYDGQRVDNLSEKEIRNYRKKASTIFQSFNLFSSRNAGQNIAFPLEIAGKLSKKEIDCKIEEMLEVVGLPDKKNAPISTLSGGQKQRIAIARALVTKPDILYCDEATSALDPQTTKSILDLIKKIQKEMSLTVIMITHQMEVVRDSCDYVSVLDKGRIVETGTTNDVFLNPKTTVTKNFVMNTMADSSAGIIKWSNKKEAYLIAFPGDLKEKPVLSELSKKFDVTYNIMAAGVQKLPNGSIGKMILDFEGSDLEVEKSISYLKQQGISVSKYIESEEE